MRILLVGMALLMMSLASGVAMARFAIHGSLTGDSGGLAMPRADLQSYSALCGSCTSAVATADAVAVGDDGA